MSGKTYVPSSFPVIIDSATYRALRDAEVDEDGDVVKLTLPRDAALVLQQALNTIILPPPLREEERNF